MDFEFDKEMDSLLRQAARGETVFADGYREPKIQNPKLLHLDADEISAFAENALTTKMRARAIEHLADCTRCRTILSSLIALGGETQSETIHASETIVPAAAAPWYKRLFTFPQMTYAMGALSLLFAVVVGFVVLESRNESQNSSVAQVEKTAERPLNGKGASSDGETVSSETFSSNAVGANTATNSNTALMSNTATAATPALARSANSNTSVAVQEKKPETEPTQPPGANPAPVAAPPAPPTTDTASIAGTGENRVQSDGDAPRDAERSRADAQNNSALNQQNIAPDSRSVQRRAQTQDLSLSERSARETQTQSAPAAPKRKAEEQKEKDSKKSVQPEETRSAGGKTFRRADGVWYDTAYRNQPTTNVSRGTDEFNRLNVRLRQIAGSLNGVIVVVFNGRAYRIQ